MRDVSLSDPRFDDFPDERAATPKRRGAASPAPKKKGGRGGMFERRRLGVMTLVAIGGLALIGVPMNALFFQDGRHPAPLFSTRVVTPEKLQTAQTPTPPARPAKIDAPARDAESVKGDAAASRPVPKVAVKMEPARTDPLAALLKSDAAPASKPEKKREVVSRDQIGALLGGEPKKPVAAPADAASPAPPVPDRNVLSAQRALQRLGYVVKPDGVASPGLRKAIEKFERDNGLPVTGELTPKVGKAIAQRMAAGRQ
ncbi:peptidoglycan-binding domain-containing protein [Methylocystis echinoides]|uniref:peptidoglycan-binding domain-containing protein n=1 Tax=Methylocystis echinoides TaxID=29468 RepID=UPI003441E850